MINRFLLSCLFLCLFGFVNAGSHSSILMKNGSEIKGDIVVQRIGKDMSVKAESASLRINPKDIVAKKTRNVKYENLPRELKRWALENRALKGDAYGRYLELQDIRTKSNSLTGLVCKPGDAENDRYYLVTPATLNLKWNDIQSIEKNISKAIQYDLTDVIETTDGKQYKGRLKSQKAGADLTLQGPDGQVTLPNKIVREIRKVKNNDSDSYFSNVDYSNVVVLKNGTEKDGLIITNHYGLRAKDNYITLIDRKGKREDIPLFNITEFRTDYTDFGREVYAPGNVYINEFKIDNARAESVADNLVFVEKQVFPFPEGITITFKSNGSKLAGGWSLVSLTEIQTTGGRNSWGYSRTQKADNTIPPKSMDSDSSLSSIVYGYLSPGYYALVNETNTEAYLFKITK